MREVDGRTIGGYPGLPATPERQRAPWRLALAPRRLRHIVISWIARTSTLVGLIGVVLAPRGDDTWGHEHEHGMPDD